MIGRRGHTTIGSEVLVGMELGVKHRQLVCSLMMHPRSDRVVPSRIFFADETSNTESAEDDAIKL